MIYEALFSGFFTSLGLILAIGAQNAFVLKCGLKGQHIFVVCLICAISDALLIAAGILGLGHITQSLPWLGTAALIAGVIFVSVYGIMRIQAFRKPEKSDQTTINIPRLGHTIAITLGFTWLNPHVYLDTFFLIGTISTQFTGAIPKLYFGIGATMASISFFFALGYSARLLAPIFNSPERWRYIDLAIGIIMFIIAGQLINKAIT